MPPTYIRKTLFHGGTNRAKLPNRYMMERAWAAGFFDGEGSTHVGQYSPRKRREPVCYARLSIGQAGEHAKKILERFKVATRGHGKFYGPKPPNKHQKLYQYTYVVTNFQQIIDTLQYMWPWLSKAKREQATFIIRKHVDSRLPNEKD